MGSYNLGIDIGGTFVKYALVDDHYDIIDKWKVETVKFESKDEFYDYICLNIKYKDEIKNIGVSAPGVIDDKSNVRTYAAPNVAIMYGTNIANEIKMRTGKNVAAINDGKAAGLCELKIGNAKGCKSSAFLILGTGTGGSICDVSGVIYGIDGYAGEFHNILVMDYSTGAFKKLGDYASVSALIKIFNSKSHDEIVQYGHEVCEKYLNGDEIAKSAINKWINNITVQLITITAIYNPEVICIGGGISEENWIIDLIRENFKMFCIKHFNTDIISTKIDVCKYNNEANILGAIINC